MTRVGRRAFLQGLAVSGGVAMAGCTGGSPSDGTESGPPDQSAGDASGTSTGSGAAAGQSPGGSEAWRSITLSEVDSGETFSVDSFAGQPVILESFAVWCPVCTTQQKQVAKFREQRSDLVAISLNTDPNENANRVREHKATHGFDWRYAVAPPAMTESLIDTFGIIITNAPAAPVVRICPDGSASLVSGGGAKSAKKLGAAFADC